MAIEAVAHARQLMPRVTGSTANRLTPVYGDGYFGIYFITNQYFVFDSHFGMS